ncbi:ankyrin [Tricholoma matsutake]|nr:ankyrin [Tricholoma matsutake 945]
MAAAESGHHEVVKILLGTTEVDVNAIDSKDEQTALSRAAESGHNTVVKLLLEAANVDLNAGNIPFGQTALCLAAKNGHDAVVKVLLDTGKVDVAAPVSGPDPKKACWSPAASCDPFANYGYGPPHFSFPSQPSLFFSFPPELHFNSFSTQSKLCPAAATTTTTATANPNGPAYPFAANAYNMLGIGLPILNGFPYNANFPQFPIQNFNQHNIPSLNLNIPNAQADLVF